MSTNLSPNSEATLEPERSTAPVTPIKSVNTESIDLAPLFFTGPTFHWPNVAVSLAEWPNPQWTKEKHDAGMATDTRDVFWFNFKHIELFFTVNKATVDWGHTEWTEPPKGFFVTTPAVLPTDPDHLLILLGLESHPEAGDIAQFWLALQKFFPFLSAFMINVAWPDPNLMKML